VFDGVAGDVAPGNGNYDLARETLTTGRSRSIRVAVAEDDPELD